MNPTQGRIVLYTTHTGDVWPAIVVAITDVEGRVSLVLSVFAREDVWFRDGVRQALTSAGEPGCWHWPPRVPS